MKIEDWYLSLKGNPEKLAKVFKVIWATSYAVLILGFILIIYVLIYS